MNVYTYTYTAVFQKPLYLNPETSKCILPINLKPGLLQHHVFHIMGLHEKIEIHNERKRHYKEKIYKDHNRMMLFD